MINKKIKLVAFFSILLCWVTLAYAFSSGPPPANTGAPGEGRCSDCHRGSNPTGNVKITGLPTSYTLGTKYSLTVTVSETGKMRWGFQVTALRDDGSAAGTLMVSDAANTQMVTGSVSGRSRMYIEHSSNGTQRGTKDTASFKLDWVAPSSDVGRVTFYIAGNAANGDGSSGNDNTYFINTSIMSGGGGTTNPAPTLTNINPTTGPASGGTTVTLNGSNFVSGATVTVDSSKVTPTFVDAKTLRIVTPAHAAGGVDIVVTNPDGQVTRLRSAFVYASSQIPAPTVNSINPNSGPTSGGTMVTLTGNSFSSGATVMIGQRQATMVSVTSTQITAITQPGDAGTVNVVVTNSDGQASTLSGGFTYIGGSTSAMVQLLNPNGSEVLSSGGLPFMVNWMVMSPSSATQRLELSTDSGQTFNTIITDNLSADKTSFLYAVPSGINTNKARIRISVIDNGAIMSDTSDADFKISPAPSITAVTPTVAASIKLKITGTNFQTGAIVEVNGQSAPSTVVKSATSIIAKKINKSLAGQQVSVRVKNPDGTISMEMVITP